MPPKSGLTPEPLGFPKCGKCPLVSTGAPKTCATCVASSSPLQSNRCPICCRALHEGPCGNPVCGWDDRDVRVVYAIAKRTGAIENVLKKFKYDGKAGWAMILGRIVIGWLEANPDLAYQFDVITVNPTHADRSPLRHTELILEAAKTEDQLGWWPLDDPNDTVLRKHDKTASVTAYGTTWRAKKQAADELCWAVDVAHPERVEGKTVLVVDDVTTTLLQLNVIAGLLKGAGAAEVDGLVIARQGG
jgi:predicted amidophosphoribosyltransferase